MTSNGWPMVSLGSLLTRVKEEVDLQDDVIYKQTTVRLWNKGVVLRGEQSGREIKTKRQFRIHSGQLVLSRIDVRNGAIGLVPPELDNAIISNDFWTYEVDQGQLAPKFLALCVTTPSFQDEANRASSGTTHRIRAEEEGFLHINVPLPPFDEQQRIVARIEELAAKIEEARGLRQRAVEEAEALLVSVSRKAFQPHRESQEVILESVCATIIDNLHSNPEYSENGTVPCIRSPDVGWGKLFLDSALKTDEVEYARRTVRGEPTKDDVVLVREGGGTGKAAIVEEGQRFSLGQRVMMIRPNKVVVLPKFFLYQLLSPQIYEDQILPLSKGSASPHLNIGTLRQFRFLLFPLPEQRRIVAYLDDLQAKVDAVKRLQAETSAELDALLPSVLDRAFKGEL